MFRGANAINLDAKGRLAMPSRYRDELDSRSSGQLIVTIDAVDPCLCVYPLDEWEIIEAKLRALPSLREENRRLQRLLIGNAVDLELDGSGRFLVPPRLREYNIRFFIEIDSLRSARISVGTWNVAPPTRRDLTST